MPVQKTNRSDRRPAASNPAPEVVYSQPKPFQRRKLMLQLITIFAIVLAVFMGVSVFFRVDTVMVSGASQYSADTVWEASGIQKGDSLLFFGRARAYSQIDRQLPYISNVRFGIKLPGTVMIIVEEIPVAYAIQDASGSWWLMSSQGKVVEKTDAAGANNCTRITGVQLDSPQVGQQAVAYQPALEPDAVGPLGSDRLQAALQIACQMERNEMFGEVSTVDVSDPYDLKLWYATRLEVQLGDPEDLERKIATMKAAVIELGPQCAGVLDIRFTQADTPIYYQPKD